MPARYRVGCRAAARRSSPMACLTVSRRAEPREPPPPRAVFTSNPLRGLDWLLDLWATRIAPPSRVPSCTSIAARRCMGPTAITRGGWRRAGARRGAVRCGVRRHPPVRPEELAAVLAQSRVMLYRGDPGETFCTALAEAQAIGLPVVVQPVGMRGRAGRRRHHRHGRGRRRGVRGGGDRLLRDDELWRRFHQRRWRASAA